MDDSEKAADQEEANLFLQRYLEAHEAEATATFGPSEIRERKNRRYVERLTRRFSEAMIRGMLQALSTLEEPKAAANLAKHDLEGKPLWQIIQPFEIFGFKFRVTAVEGKKFTVSFGESHGTCGSGGEVVLEQTEPGKFRVVEQGIQWIA